MDNLPPRAYTRRSILGASGALGLSGVIGPHIARATSGSRDAEETGTAKFLQLMGYVDKRMDELGIPAVGVAVVDADKRHTCALGITSVDDPQLVDAETMFRLGPLTRLFTGSAIGELVESGAVRLEEPLGTYLSSFARKPITVGDLVTHRTGWPADLAFDRDDSADALHRFTEATAALDDVAPPGEYLNYGRTDGIVAGQLVAHITGLPFEAAMRELTLSPLSLSSSSFVTSELQGLPAVQGHTRKGGAVTPVDPVHTSQVAVPVTGLLSNLNEVLHFVAFHAFASTPPTYIAAPVREMMHRPLGPGGSVGPVRIDAMGVNWMISEFGGMAISMHAGTDSGQSGMMVVAPSRKFGVVVLTNADFGQDLAIEIAFRALDLFHGVRPPAVTAVERPASELGKLAGVYAMAEGTSLRIMTADSGLTLEARSAGGSVPGVSENLTFVSPLTARLTMPESTLYVDFVLDHRGNVGWLRHMGQLAARVDE